MTERETPWERVDMTAQQYHAWRRRILARWLAGADPFDWLCLENTPWRRDAAWRIYEELDRRLAKAGPAAGADGEQGE